MFLAWREINNPKPIICAYVSVHIQRHLHLGCLERNNTVEKEWKEKNSVKMLRKISTNAPEKSIKEKKKKKGKSNPTFLSHSGICFKSLHVSDN